MDCNWNYSQGTLPIWSHSFWIMNWGIHFWLKDFVDWNIIRHLVWHLDFTDWKPQIGQVTWFVQGHKVSWKQSPCFQKSLNLWNFNLFLFKFIIILRISFRRDWVDIFRRLFQGAREGKREWGRGRGLCHMQLGLILVKTSERQTLGTTRLSI